MTTQSTTMSRSGTRPAAALWASAFVIAALAIVQAGQLPGNSAHAETTSEFGDYTLLTAPTISTSCSPRAPPGM